ncbi:MAG TPA: rhodanese-like domain-containing protein [Bacteroidales bacterium]|nr:rhodanese-like domain-containing protein [Bacteroidales bacterium]
MQTRVKYSIVLVMTGLILALLPLSGYRPFSVAPDKLLSDIIKDTSSFTVDQVAELIVDEDSSVRLIDLRPAEEFRKNSIPGSINIPYSHFLDIDPQNYFLNRKIMNIFYSGDDITANYAWVIAKGFGFNNVSVMKGGLDEWYKTIMNSNFNGERITARQNAIFETRINARKIFTEINNLPDSLKRKYLQLKRVEKQKLDGGC